MITVAKLVAGLVLLVPTASLAAFEPKDVANGLKGAGVFLRGAFVENELTFDAQGNATSPATPGPFWFSAVRIDRVDLSDHDLQIEGHRALLIANGHDDPPSIPELHLTQVGLDKISVKIARDPAAGPDALAAVVGKVFASSIDDALQGTTIERRNLALSSFASLAPPNTAGAKLAKGKDATDLHANGGSAQAKAGIKAPRLIYAPPPLNPVDASGHPISGMLVAEIIVDKSGRPTHVRIIRSPSPDLAISALLRASQYRFAPATYLGEPISVAVNIELLNRPVSDRPAAP